MGLTKNKISKYVLREDWITFMQKCETADIKTLQNTYRILELGVLIYANMSANQSIAGLGSDPRKFSAARDIVGRIISKRLLIRT